jgi:hypothetical protein
MDVALKLLFLSDLKTVSQQGIQGAIFFERPASNAPPDRDESIN